MISIKPVIGIAPNSTYMETSSSYLDSYVYANNFIKAILENGGIPYLIPYESDEIIYDVLDGIDGLLLPGGRKVSSTVFPLIDEFYNSGKPILGVCLGMQTLAMYSMKKDGIDKRILEKIPSNNHYPVEMNRMRDDLVTHEIRIKKGTKLYDLTKCTNASVNSVHNFCINEVGSDFIVSARSMDGVIEGIECRDPRRFVMGVQWHPEVLKRYDVIFKEFISQTSMYRVRKNNLKLRSSLDFLESLPYLCKLENLNNFANYTGFVFSSLVIMEPNDGSSTIVIPMDKIRYLVNLSNEEFLNLEDDFLHINHSKVWSKKIRGLINGKSYDKVELDKPKVLGRFVKGEIL